MPLNIKDENTHQAARELAQARGVSITEAVTVAIQEALVRERGQRHRQKSDLSNTLDEIALHCADLPLLDARSPDDILGYDDSGAPV